MRKWPLFLFALFLVSPLPAQSEKGQVGPAAAPDGLIRRLESLDTRAPLTVEVFFSKKGTEPETIVKATDGPTGLQIEWPTALLEKFAGASKPSDSKRRSHDLLDRAEPSVIYGYLHAADHLLEHLATAHYLGETLLREGETELRELAFKLDPGLDQEAKKYVKDISIELKLITTADYTPVRASVASRVRGRAFMVISFGEDATETYSFSVWEGRLVTSLHTRDSKTSGTGGENEDQKQVILQRL